VDAGLGERERCPEDFPRSRAPLEKVKAFLPSHCANLVATGGHSSNKMIADDDDDDGNSFLLLFNFEALAYLTVVHKIKWQEVHIRHVY
jgi:hypothetical protein